MITSRVKQTLFIKRKKCERPKELQNLLIQLQKLQIQIGVPLKFTIKGLCIFFFLNSSKVRHVLQREQGVLLN